MLDLYRVDDNERCLLCGAFASPGVFVIGRKYSRINNLTKVDFVR